MASIIDTDDDQTKGLSPALKSGIAKGVNIAAPVVGSLISGGYNNKAGKAISSIGTAVGGAVGAVNPLLGAAIVAGSNIIGGLTTRAFGQKWNDDNIADVEGNISAMRGKANLSNASSTNQVLNNWSNTSMGYNFNKKYIGSDGWLSNKVAKKTQKLQGQQDAARSYVINGLASGAQNADKASDSAAMQNFVAAYGGPLDTINNDNMGAIEYGFMSDYLTTKQNPGTRHSSPVSYLGTMPSVFAFGGNMQTNSADFPTGLTHVDEGGTHEQNPNDGVPMGVTSKGEQALVEEGETIHDDFVFSDRIEMDEKAKEQFKIRKNKNITYAEFSKQLEKEVEERPNDPISKEALDVQLKKLANAQEEQKLREEAKEAQKAFAALPPEAQVAAMQQIASGAQDMQAQAMAAEEQAVQQQAAQEQALQEQAMQEQAMQQGAAQEQALQQQAEEQALQQQMAQEQANQGIPQGEPQSAAPYGQEPEGMAAVSPEEMQAMQATQAAYGGLINRYFDDGGDKDDEDTESPFEGRNDEYLRTAGILGPVVGTAMQLSGIGKPDYSRLDKVWATVNQPTALASYQPISHYLRYNPMDIQDAVNRADANNRAAQRTLMNSATPIGSRNASLLSLAATQQANNADLYAKALEYNNNLRSSTAEFNRATDMQNANAYNTVSTTNANIRNNDRQAKAQLLTALAKERMDSDASWYSNLYGNVGQIFTGLSDIGKEAAAWNMNVDNYNRGARPTKAKGGRLHLKGRRGLTY